ncbi:MAG: hypothetical protein AAF590_01260 [Pseudomonadota bacterium]
MTLPAEKKPTLADWGGYIAMRTLRACVLGLGIRRGVALSGWCWKMIAPLTKRQARALSQMAAAMPELSAQERDRNVRAMWQGLGETFAEGLILDRLMELDGVVSIEGADLFHQATNADTPTTGMVIISMHSGNWEVLGLGARDIGLEAAALYQTVANPLVDRKLRDTRSHYWKAGLISKGSHAIKRTVGLLRAGKGVGIMADQRQAGGLSVPFFGHPAPSTPLPASLALRTGSRLIACRAKRMGTCRYVLEVKELPVTQTLDRDADIERLLIAIHAQFEAWIRERPHEWMWAHRRWSREVLTASPGME